MYYTSNGWERVSGPLWNLFLHGAISLVEEIYRDEPARVGVKRFDKLKSIAQMTAIIDVCQRMRHPTETEDIYAYHDATVAAVICQLETDLDWDWDRIAPNCDGKGVDMCGFFPRMEAVILEMRETDDSGELEELEYWPDGRIKATKDWWREQIQELHEVYLADSDYQLSASKLNTFDKRAAAGVIDDYFSAKPDKNKYDEPFELFQQFTYDANTIKRRPAKSADTEVEESNGKLFAVLRVDPLTGRTSPCPFCGAIHTHGVQGDAKGGHRMAHCVGDKDSMILTLKDERTLHANDGYLLRPRPRVQADGVFSAKLKCFWIRWVPLTDTDLALVLPANNSCDMTGAIEVAQLLCPLVTRIEVMEERRMDVIYSRPSVDEPWHATIVSPSIP
jgi:hypothetical protein